MVHAVAKDERDFRCMCCADQRESCWRRRRLPWAVRDMLIEVCVDRHVDGFGFKHSLVERTGELSIGYDGADGFKCRGGRGSCLPWRGELWES